MQRMLSTLAAAWALFGGLLLLVIVVVTCWNVMAFVVGVRGLPGYEDAVRLLLSAAALTFFPWCQVRRGHVAVDVLVGALPRRVRAGLDRLALAATAALAAFLAYWMALGLLETRADRAASSILGWPEWPFYAPGVISLLLWAAVATTQCLGQRATEPRLGA